MLTHIRSVANCAHNERAIEQSNKNKTLQTSRATPELAFVDDVTARVVVMVAAQVVITAGVFVMLASVTARVVVVAVAPVVVAACCSSASALQRQAVLRKSVNV